ncbi:hypothetical protein ACFE04_019575 [Oxalis oulophora]
MASSFGRRQGIASYKKAFRLGHVLCLSQAEKSKASGLSNLLRIIDIQLYLVHVENGLKIFLSDLNGSTCLLSRPRSYSPLRFEVCLLNPGVSDKASNGTKGSEGSVPQSVRGGSALSERGEAEKAACTVWVSVVIYLIW